MTPIFAGSVTSAVPTLTWLASNAVSRTSIGCETGNEAPTHTFTFCCAEVKLAVIGLVQNSTAKHCSIPTLPEWANPERRVVDRGNVVECHALGRILGIDRHAPTGG